MSGGAQAVGNNPHRLFFVYSKVIGLLPRVFPDELQKKFIFKWEEQPQQRIIKKTFGK